MRFARLVGLLLLAAVATGLLSVANASAAESSNPLFSPVNNQTITGVGGPSKLIAKTGQIIECQKNSATGVVTSSLLAGKASVHYLECTGKENAAATNICTVKSVGAPEEGLIITNELHGILGLNLSPAPLDTGILFLPSSGKVFVKLAESKNATGKCTPETQITGTVAALITPIGVRTTKGLLVFPKESIKKIDLTHALGLVEPELVAFSTSSVLEQHDSITFSEATEVT